MRDWHHHRRTDVGLRLSGTALLGFAWLAVQALAALHLTQSRADPSIWAFLLAAAAFLSASLGAVLITQGHHIFDRIEIGERWRRNPPAGSLEQDHL